MEAKLEAIKEAKLDDNYKVELEAKVEATLGANLGNKWGTKLGAKIGDKVGDKSGTKLGAKLGALVLLDTNNTQNSSILINSTEFIKKVEKNTLKQPIEAKARAKKEVKNSDLL